MRKTVADMVVASRFNPHAMQDHHIEALATGRETPLQILLGVVQDNLNAPTACQHILITAPRGMGKSFFLRMTQIELRKISGATPTFILLPEEQPHITTPSTFLRHVVDLLRGRDVSRKIPSWSDRGAADWDAAVADLKHCIETLENGRKLVIVALENFDLLLKNVFTGEAAQSALRRLLAETKNLMVVATTLHGDVDRTYDNRLFQSFSHIRLRPWALSDSVAYFRKRLAITGGSTSTGAEAKLKAVSAFTGGSPRMAVVLFEMLERGDALSAAQTLDRLVDDLTPYYQDILEKLPPKGRALVDAMLRGGEPVSQSDLAARVNTTQNRIAQHFAKLRDHEVVFGEREEGGHSFLYRVADRVFVQYYRRRFIYHGQTYTPILAMAGLLEVFFTAEENRTKAIELMRAGAEEEALIFFRASRDQRKVSDRGMFGTRVNQIMIDAEALWQNGFREKAYASLKDAVDLKREQYSPTLAAEAARGCAMLLEKEERWNEAFQARERAHELAKDIGDHELVALNLNGMAMLSKKLGKYSDEAEFRDKSIACLEQYGPVSRLGGVLLQRARQLERAGRHKEAISDAARALDLLGDEADAGLRFRSHSRARGIFATSGDAERASKANDTCLTIALEANNSSWAVEALSFRSGELEKSGQLNGAIDAGKDGYAHAVSGGLPNLAVAMAERVALLFARLNDQSASLDWLRNALNNCDESIPDERKAFLWMRIGDAERSLGRSDGALASYRRGASLGKKEDPKRENVWCLRTLAFHLRQRGQADEALLSEKKALEFSIGLPDPHARSTFVEGILSTLAGQGSIGEVERIVAMLLHSAETRGEIGHRAWFYRDAAWALGVVLLRHERAIIAREKALEVAKQHRDASLIVDNIGGIGWNLAYLGRHEEAVEKFREALICCSGEQTTAIRELIVGNLAANLASAGKPKEAVDLLISESTKSSEKTGADYYWHFGEMFFWIEKNGGAPALYKLATEFLRECAKRGGHLNLQMMIERSVVSYLMACKSGYALADALADSKKYFPKGSEAVFGAAQLVLECLRRGDSKRVLQHADPDIARATKTIVEALRGIGLTVEE